MHHYRASLLVFSPFCCAPSLALGRARSWTRTFWSLKKKGWRAFFYRSVNFLWGIDLFSFLRHQPRWPDADKRKEGTQSRCQVRASHSILFFRNKRQKSRRAPSETSWLMCRASLLFFFLFSREASRKKRGVAGKPLFMRLSPDNQLSSLPPNFMGARLHKKTTNKKNGDSDGCNRSACTGVGCLGRRVHRRSKGGKKETSATSRAVLFFLFTATT